MAVEKKASHSSRRRCLALPSRRSSLRRSLCDRERRETQKYKDDVRARKKRSLKRKKAKKKKQRKNAPVCSSPLKKKNEEEVGEKKRERERERRKRKKKKNESSSDTAALFRYFSLFSEHSFLSLFSFFFLSLVSSSETERE